MKSAAAEILFFVGDVGKLNFAPCKSIKPSEDPDVVGGLAKLEAVGDIVPSGPEHGTQPIPDTIVSGLEQLPRSSCAPRKW